MCLEGNQNQIKKLYIKEIKSNIQKKIGFDLHEAECKRWANDKISSRLKIQGNT